MCTTAGTETSSACNLLSERNARKCVNCVGVQEGLVCRKLQSQEPTTLKWNTRQCENLGKKKESRKLANPQNLVEENGFPEC